MVFFKTPAALFFIFIFSQNTVLSEDSLWYKTVTSNTIAAQRYKVVQIKRSSIIVKSNKNELLSCVFDKHKDAFSLTNYEYPVGRLRFLSYKNNSLDERLHPEQYLYLVPTDVTTSSQRLATYNKIPYKRQRSDSGFDTDTDTVSLASTEIVSGVYTDSELDE